MIHRFETMPARSRQSGVVLFIALILLVILSMIGVTVARMQTVEERMARNEDNRQMALQAAEAALRNAEDGLSISPGISSLPPIPAATTSCRQRREACCRPSTGMSPRR